MILPVGNANDHSTSGTLTFGTCRSGGQAPGSGGSGWCACVSGCLEERGDAGGGDRLGGEQPDAEDRAVAGGRRDVDCPVHRLDQRPRDGQAEPVALDTAERRSRRSNGWNSRLSCWKVIPTPESITSRRTPSAPSGRARTVIEPPGRLYLIAFEIRLSSTCLRRRGSARPAAAPRRRRRSRSAIRRPRAARTATTASSIRAADIDRPGSSPWRRGARRRAGPRSAPAGGGRRP